MSTAKLNVWVTAVGEPCKIDEKHQWYVHILHCNGELLRWCDKIYVNLKTKCGQLEEEVPPGCYMVVATWSPARGGSTVPTSLGNHISHLASVRVNCGDHACVTLFPPTFHFCGIWWITALRHHVNAGAVDKQLGENAVEAVNAVLEKTPRHDPFLENLLKIEELQTVPEGR